MTFDEYHAARWLVRAVSSTLSSSNGGEEGVDTALARLAAQDLSEAAFRRPPPGHLPVCRYLPDVVAATLVVAPDVAAALVAVDQDLCWRQNPNYSNAAMGNPHYMDNYGYSEIIGPGGFWPGEDFLLGLFLLGPGLHYPDHNHAAPELYWLLSGDSRWSRDEGPFEPRDPGDTVWHDPHVMHATRTGPQPFFAIYMWTREVSAFARLKGR